MLVTTITPVYTNLSLRSSLQTPAAEAYSREAWLFLGVANSDSLLYSDEWEAAKAKPTANGGKVRKNAFIS